MITNDHIIKLMTRAKKYALKREGMLPNGITAEDFGQEYAIECLTRKPRKIKWSFIDFVREYSGRKGSNSYLQRQNLARPASFNIINSAGKDSPSYEDLISDGIYDCAESAGVVLFESGFYQKLNYLNEREQKIIIMNLQGYTTVEIAHHFLVSEGRISQIFSKCIEKLKDSYEGKSGDMEDLSLKDLFLKTGSCYE